MSPPPQGGLFVLSAPSGAGKTTVCRGVVARDAGVVLSVSHTTRAPRAGEQNGVEYHFVSRDEFQRMVGKGAFLEHAEYSGHCYGTSWAAIETPLERGLDVLLEIETQGARQVRTRRPDAHRIFLLPPSLEALDRRLRRRGTESDGEVERRLAIARSELAEARAFDWFVVNEDAERAIDDVLSIVHAARRRELDSIAARFGFEAACARVDAALAGAISG